VFIQLTFKAHR